MKCCFISSSAVKQKQFLDIFKSEGVLVIGKKNIQENHHTLDVRERMQYKWQSAMTKVPQLDDYCYVIEDTYIETKSGQQIVDIGTQIESLGFDNVIKNLSNLGELHLVSAVFLKRQEIELLFLASALGKFLKEKKNAGITLEDYFEAYCDNLTTPRIQAFTKCYKYLTTGINAYEKKW